MSVMRAPYQIPLTPYGYTLTITQRGHKAAALRLVSQRPGMTVAELAEEMEQERSRHIYPHADLAH
jgi:hypothetical protein